MSKPGDCSDLSREEMDFLEYIQAMSQEDQAALLLAMHAPR